MHRANASPWRIALPVTIKPRKFLLFCVVASTWMLASNDCARVSRKKIQIKRERMREKMLQKSKVLAIMIAERILKYGPNQPERKMKPQDRRKPLTPIIGPTSFKNIIVFSVLVLFFKFMTGNTHFAFCFQIYETNPVHTPLNAQHPSFSANTCPYVLHARLK